MAGCIDVSMSGDAFTVRGDRVYQCRFDCVRSPGRGKTYSLQAGWVWDDDRLRITSDRLGLIPLFIFMDEQRIVLSDELALVVAALSNPKLDDAALSVFLRLGFFIGDDTPYKSIKVLPPNIKAEWTGRPLHLKECHCSVAATDIGRREAVSAYYELFKNSVRRRVHEGSVISVPLSGGRDSRHILAQLIDLGTQPYEAITAIRMVYGHSEIAAAARLAETYGLTHKIAGFGFSSFISDELLKNDLTHCLSDEHAWYLGVLSHISPKANQVFDGIGGDVLSNGLFFDADLMSKMKERKLVQAARKLLPDIDLKYLRADLRRRMDYEAACHRLTREMARHVETPNPVKSFFFWNRTRREIALSPICLAGRNFKVSMPYLDGELFDFLISLPGESFGEPGLHDEVIRRHFAEIAEVPYPEKGPARISRRIQWRMSASAVAFFATHSPSRSASLSFLISRMTKALLRGLEDEMWWVSRLVYLHSLNEMSSGRTVLRERPFQDGNTSFR